MISATLTIELTEPRPTFHDRHEVEDAAGMPLSSLRLIVQDLIGDIIEASPGVVRFRPATTAGSVQVNGLRLVVRPRLTQLDLVTLIRFAHGTDIQTFGRTTTAIDEYGLEEMIASLFAEELDRIRVLGVSRRYLRIEDRPRAIRGAVNFTASFPWRERGMTSAACSYHELSTDVLDNRLIRAALERTERLNVGPLTKTSLREHRRAWRDLADIAPATCDAFSRARAGYSRLNLHYRLAHVLAEIILKGTSPIDIYEGNEETRGIHLDLAALFESYVERLIRVAFEPRGFVVEAQLSDGGAIVDGDGRCYARIRPDFVVSRRGRPEYVIDAKYKDYGLEDVRIGNGDLYQLFFYAARLQTAYGLEGPPVSMIVSPARTGQSVPPAKRRLHLIANGFEPCHLRLALTYLPETLARIRAGDGALSKIAEDALDLFGIELSSRSMR